MLMYARYWRMYFFFQLVNGGFDLFLGKNTQLYSSLKTENHKQTQTQLTANVSHGAVLCTRASVLACLRAFACVRCVCVCAHICALCAPVCAWLPCEAPEHPVHLCVCAYVRLCTSSWQVVVS